MIKAQAARSGQHNAGSLGVVPVDAQNGVDSWRGFALCLWKLQGRPGSASASNLLSVKNEYLRRRVQISPNRHGAEPFAGIHLRNELVLSFVKTQFQIGLIRRCA